jgi:hypothetical protein
MAADRRSDGDVESRVVQQHGIICLVAVNEGERSSGLLGGFGRPLRDNLDHNALSVDPKPLL